MLTAIVGINWGDEGKGRMVDLLSQDYDYVIRYQGGNNAGHTVMNHLGKFILNLLPSGILRPEVVNIMGNGMVIDLEHLHNEMETLKAKGICITPDNLKISERAIICLPYHKLQDILEEERLGDAKYGSTRRGIAPVYGDKYLKKAIQLGELRNKEVLEKKLNQLIDWKNLSIQGVYEKDALLKDEIIQWVMKYREYFLPYITDVTTYLEEGIKKGAAMMFEAQLGALRDIDFGIYPYTSSSSTIAAYAPIGAGIPGHQLDEVIGIMKAYSSCVGEGPFVAELGGEEADVLRKEGQEYGAATGRPRRVGPFDVVASRYGVQMQGATTLALTKMDVLSYMDEIPVCIGYEIDGEVTQRFPLTFELEKAKPVYTYLEGWKEDIRHCRTKEMLPEKTLAYIQYLEKMVGCSIKYVSVGPEREDYIVME